MPDAASLLVEAPHAASSDEVAATVDVDPATGLSSDEARRRRGRYGPNSLGRQDGTPWWRLIWDQIANAVVVLLVGAALFVRPLSDLLGLTTVPAQGWLIAAALALLPLALTQGVRAIRGRRTL